MTTKTLKYFHLKLVIILASENRKRMSRFFNWHKIIRRRSEITSLKSLKRFENKSRYKKILFLSKKS